MKKPKIGRSLTALVIIFMTLLLLVLSGCPGTTEDGSNGAQAPTFTFLEKSWGFILTINSELNYDVQIMPSAGGSWGVIHSGTGSANSSEFEYTWTDQSGSEKIPKDVDIRIVALDYQASDISTINHQMATVAEADLLPFGSGTHRATVWLSEHTGVASAVWVKVYVLSGTSYSNIAKTENYVIGTVLEGSHLTLYNDAGSLVVDRWSADYIVDDDSGTGSFSQINYGLVDEDTAGYYYLLIETDNTSLNPDLKTCDTADFGYVYADFSTAVN